MTVKTLKDEKFIYELIKKHSQKYAKIIKCISNDSKISIPDRIDGYKIVHISDSAFKGCENLQEIEFDNINYIGKSAFEECISLKSIKLPAKIRVVSERCFFNCTNLKTIESVSNIKVINKSAFEGCSKLKSINSIKMNNIKSIEENAFKDCYKLSVDMKLDSLSNIGDMAFENCKQSIIVGDSLKYDNGNRYESINSLTKTKWGLSGKYLLPFFIVAILCILVNILICLLGYTNQGVISKINCIFSSLFFGVLTFPFAKVYLQEKSKVWAALCCFFVALSSIFLICFIAVDQKKSDRFNNVNLSEIDSDSKYSLSFEPQNPQYNIYNITRTKTTYGHEGTDNNEDNYSIGVENDDDVLIDITYYDNSKDISDIKLEFSPNNNTLDLTVKNGVKQYYLKHKDRLIEPLKYTDNDGNRTYSFDVKKYNVFSIEQRIDDQDDSEELFAFALNTATQEISFFAGIITLILLFVSAASLFIALLFLLSYLSAVQSFLESYKTIIIIGLIIAYAVLSLSNGQSESDTLLTSIQAFLGV